MPAGRAKVVAVANQKGGVGKTTTAVNLAAAVNKAGSNALLIDFDPQGNSTSGYGVAKNAGTTVYELLMSETDPAAGLVRTDFGDIVPANINLAGAEIELAQMQPCEYRLKRITDRLAGGYDYIFIDCPPSLGLLTINALAAADSVLVPMQAEYFALEGLTELLNSIKLIRKKINTRLVLDGVILTMYDGRTNLSIQVVDELKRYFGSRLYKTAIPRNVRLAEAPSYGMPVIYYDKFCRGTESYNNLAQEFLKKNA